jgi:hypothetical protein
VIVRISMESQYRLPEDAAEELNELDNQVVAAVEAGDEDRFHSVFEQMLDLVGRVHGRGSDPGLALGLATLAWLRPLHLVGLLVVRYGPFPTPRPAVGLGSCSMRCATAPV